jgi:hypothetical protein
MHIRTKSTPLLPLPVEMDCKLELTSVMIVPVTVRFTSLSLTNYWHVQIIIINTPHHYVIMLYTENPEHPDD